MDTKKAVLTTVPKSFQQKVEKILLNAQKWEKTFFF